MKWGLIGLLMVIILPHGFALVRSGRVALRRRTSWGALVAGTLLTVLLSGLFGLLLGGSLDLVGILVSEEIYSGLQYSYVFIPFCIVGAFGNVYLALVTGPVLGIVSALVVNARSPQGAKWNGVVFSYLAAIPGFILGLVLVGVVLDYLFPFSDSWNSLLPLAGGVIGGIASFVALRTWIRSAHRGVQPPGDTPEPPKDLT